MVAVSLALPVYNGERHLAETLDSLLAQEFDDFELLISDNGSADGTPDLVRDYATRHAGSSSSVTRSTGVRSGTTTTWWTAPVAGTSSGAGTTTSARPPTSPGASPTLDGSDAVVAYPRTVLIDDTGAVKRQYDDGLDLRQAEPYVRVRECLRHLGLANAVFGLIRVDVLRGTPLFGAYNDSDLVLILDLALAGEIHEIDEWLFSCRMHPGQAYQANTTPLAVRRWFDPSSRSRFVLPRSRRFVEAARAIGRARLPLGERARCAVELVRVWGPSHLYHGLSELGRAARDVVAPSS